WPRIVPAAGAWLMINWLTGVQLSAATTLESTLGTAAWQLPSADTVNEEGALTIAGGVVSAMLKSTFVVVLLPEASMTDTTIVCCPRPSNLPATGLCVIINCAAGVQLSVATTLVRTLGTAAWQLASAEEVVEIGALRITGGVVSMTEKE